MSMTFLQFFHKTHMWTHFLISLIASIKIYDLPPSFQIKVFHFALKNIKVIHYLYFLRELIKLNQNFSDIHKAWVSLSSKLKSNGYNDSKIKNAIHKVYTQYNQNTPPVTDEEPPDKF